MPPLSDLEVDTSWSAADALALLDDHDGCLPAALVRLDTLRAMEFARLDRILRLRRMACRWSRRRFDEMRRDTQIAIGQEVARRVMLLQEVARTQGQLTSSADA